MSLANQTVKNVFNGNGVVVTFAIGADYFTPAQVQVYLVSSLNVPVLQILGTNYNIVGPNVVFVVAPPSGTKVVVVRGTETSQIIDYINTGEFIAEDHERGLDRIVMMIQELYSRALLIPASTPLNSFGQPSIPVAGKAIGVKTDGSGWEFLDSAAIFGLVVSRPAPLAAGATIPISPTAVRQIVWVQSTGGLVTLNASLPIQNGVSDGQELYIMGASFVNTLLLPTGGSLDAISDIQIEKLRNTQLVWDGPNSKWVEFVSTI